MAVCDVGKGAIKKRSLQRLKRRVVVQQYNGLTVTRAWPQPKGRTRGPLEQAWIDKFTRVNQATKYADACAVSFAQCLTPNTGWYYRDVLATAMYGKLMNEFGEPRLKTPTAKVSRSTAVALTAGVFTILTPDVVTWDNNALWNPALNPSRITFQSAGLYLVGAQVSFTAVTGGRRFVELLDQNNVTICVSSIPVANANVMRLVVFGLFYAHAGDWMRLSVMSSVAGVSVNLEAMYALAMTPENLIP